MSVWLVGWILWGAWFAIEEGLAVRAGRGTLTAQLLRLFAVTASVATPLVRVRRTLLLLGLAWLAAHLVTGGRFV
jgi:hypothetical protein